MTNSPSLRIADRQRRYALGQLCSEGIGHGALDDHALGRHADLPGIGVGAEHGGIDRGVDIGIGEHDQGRLAAEFEQHRLQVFRRQLRQDAPDPG